MSDEKSRHADTIIRNHAMWSVASGAIPIALADLAAVSAVQLDMIRQLCEVYDIDFSATRGKAMVTSITSAALARVGAASVVKMVPVAGQLLGSITGGVLAGASSYALGTAFKTHLGTGGTFLDLDTDRLKRVYREQFEKGKAVVKDWQREQEEAAATAEGTDAADGADAGSAGGGFRFGDIVRRARERGPGYGKRAAADVDVAADADVAADSDVAAGGEEASGQAAAADASTQASSQTIAKRLGELAQLREQGLISEADYEATKARLLGQL